MPAFVASLGRETGRSNWEICKRESLMATRAGSAGTIRTGDDVYIWLGQTGLIAQTRVTTDARAVQPGEQLPWPDLKPYRYVWSMQVVSDRVDDPPAESWSDLQAGAGITASPQFFPRVPSRGEGFLESLLAERLSPIEAHLLAQLNLPSADERAYRRVLAAVRQGQSSFRASVDTAYGGRCAITGVADRTALEAAHIAPYLGVGSNDPRNGLLLRRDAHALFDAFLMTITAAGDVVVAPSVMSSDFRAWRRANLPTAPQHAPDPTALLRHNTEFHRRHP